MASEEQPLPRIGRPVNGNRDFHAPVTAHVHESGVQVVTFTGAEEGDVLHAAGAWMNEHPNVLLISVNWHGDFLSPYDEIDNVPGPPRHRLDLTVDRTGEC
ncbi:MULTISPECIES: hypothetical protein [unclassified Streptomyces]|uniref:hypothetical protein n=1 Tax=unclassified Streptomyces TaxID=2593676 RepID=UPI0033B2E3AF